MTFPAPAAYGPSWLPLAEAATSDPVSVTAWTLPSMTSGDELRRRISSACVSRSMLQIRGWMGSYRPELWISSAMPVSSSDCEAPLWTWAPAGTRLQDDPFRLLGIRGADDADSVGLESGGGSRNAGIVRHRREPTVE